MELLNREGKYYENRLYELAMKLFAAIEIFERKRILGW